MITCVSRVESGLKVTQTPVPKSTRQKFYTKAQITITTKLSHTSWQHPPGAAPKFSSLIAQSTLHLGRSAQRKNAGTQKTRARPRSKPEPVNKNPKPATMHLLPIREAKEIAYHQLEPPPFPSSMPCLTCPCRNRTNGSYGNPHATKPQNRS